MLSTFYERFTFLLGNSDGWLLSAVRPAPQAWRHGLGMVTGRAGCHSNDTQIVAEWIWLESASAQTGRLWKEYGRSVLDRSGGGGFGSRLASVGRLQSDGFSGRSTTSRVVMALRVSWSR